MGFTQTCFIHIFLSLLIMLTARPTVSVSWVEGPSGDSALLCSVQDFYPESIEQDWLRDGLPLNVTPDRRSTVNPDGSYTLDSYLSLTSVHAEDVLCSCWVNHSSLDLPLKYTFQCKEHKTDAEGIITIRANKGQKIPLHCNVPEDSLNKTCNVHWRKNGDSPVLCYYRVSNNNITDSKCGSRYVIEGQPPQLYLTDVSFSDSGVYNCCVTKVVPPPAEEKVYLVDLLVEGAARPMVSVSWVEGPSGDSALLCSVQDFYPESIEQDWLRDGLPLNVTPDRRSTVNPDGSYTLDSYLSLTSVHAEDVLCSCWVNHSSLDLPLKYTFKCKEHKTVAVPISGIFCVRIIFLVFALFKIFQNVHCRLLESIHTPATEIQESPIHTTYSQV